MTRIEEPIEVTEEEKSLQEQIRNLAVNTFDRLSDNKISDIVLLLAGNESSHIAVRKFESLDTILMTAKYCLLNGCRFDHKVYSERNGMQTYNKAAQYQYNLHNLKSAVIWYNSSIDYILQIIYWGFGFNKPFTTVTPSEYKTHYRKEEKRAKWEYNNRKKKQNSKHSFTNKFMEIAATNQYAEKIKNEWVQLYNSHDAIRIRELANDIKHHSGFELVETSTARHNKIGIALDAEHTICWEEVTQLPVIGYAELLKHLIGLHNEVTSFEECLYKELGYSAVSSQIELGKVQITPSFYCLNQ